MKSNFHRLAMIAGVTALLAGASTARAADFTINVPVNYQSMTEAIGAVRVQCSLFANPGGGTGSQNIVGINYVFVETAGGAVNQTVSVPVDFGQGAGGSVNPTGFTRQDVTHARCAAMFCPTSGAAQGCAYPTADATDINYKSAPGTQLTVITGNVALQ